jgi:hypothetical protein
MLVFNYDQTMLDLVAYSLLTIHPKLGVTLSNFTELDKAIMGQDVEDFHVARGAQTLKKHNIAYK